jgi:hypothetical protein
MCSEKGHVRFTPNSDIDCVFRHACFGPIADTLSRRASLADSAVQMQKSAKLPRLRRMCSKILVASCTSYEVPLNTNAIARVAFETEVDVRFGPKADIAKLVDYLVGACHDRRWHVEAKYLGGLEIDH